MNVILKNIAQCNFIIPGVGDLASLEGLVKPGETISVDEKLAESDFVKGLMERGELVHCGNEIEGEDDALVSLRAQAEELGIKVDKRWKAARIQEEIDKVE